MGDEIHIGTSKHRLTGTKCPHCGADADGATSVNDEAAVPMPKPGDIAVCYKCASLNCYTETLGLRRVERAERRALLRDPRMKALIEICTAAVARHRRTIQ